MSKSFLILVILAISSVAFGESLGPPPVVDCRGESCTILYEKRGGPRNKIIASRNSSPFPLSRSEEIRSLTKLLKSRPFEVPWGEFSVEDFFEANRATICSARRDRADHLGNSLARLRGTGPGCEGLVLPTARKTELKGYSRMSVVCGENGTCVVQFTVRKKSGLFEVNSKPFPASRKNEIDETVRFVDKVSLPKYFDAEKFVSTHRGEACRNKIDEMAAQEAELESLSRGLLAGCIAAAPSNTAPTSSGQTAPAPVSR